MLSRKTVEQILERIPRLTIGVFGDLFLDRYLDLDAALTEPSIETGLDAYQVVGVRSYPGAAGTVINNLVALGVARVRVFAAIGADGDGFELRRALKRLAVVDTSSLHVAEDALFRTPTYMKPMLGEASKPARELNRLDIKNRQPPRPHPDLVLLPALEEAWPRLDALIVLDQVSEPECGMVTERARAFLAQRGAAEPSKPILADSRERIGLFRNVWLKPNRHECLRAVSEKEAVETCVRALAERAARPVFCTCGENGILVHDPRAAAVQPTLVPAYPVRGPIDPVGAGDSTNAGIACALATGTTLEEAAAFGNLVASITIQQLGTTGTASPEQVRRAIEKHA